MFFNRYKWNYYEVLGENRVMRQAKNSKTVYEYVNGSWQPIEESEWKKLKLSYTSSESAKKLMKKCA